MDGWERDVLVARAFFVLTALSAGAGVFLVPPSLERIFLGLALALAIAGFVPGYRAKQAYHAAGEPAAGGGE